ncbi:hypothetical protein FS837_011229 [Tulasnella sp. UAMH 9824]|nr:hypothetical protein FS837_011229 [Tulasnella sp. UAMH 9824]
MLLEGVKNVFLYVNLLGATVLMREAFEELMNSANEDWVFPEHPRIETLLLPLKMSWAQQNLDFKRAVMSEPDDSFVAPLAQVIRWYETILHNIYLLFIDEQDPEAEYEFSKYISSNDTVIYKDAMEDDQAAVSRFTDRYEEIMGYSILWVLAVSGTLLFCMAILNVMQRRPRNRFAWAYAFNRAIIGSILIFIGGVVNKLKLPVNSLYWLYWL